MAAPADFLNFIDVHKDRFIQRLASAVEIPSVSGDPVHRDDVFRMGQYGVETKAVELGTHVMDGQNLKLPPAILGRIGDDKSKRTILIYGHYDVQPAQLSDGWDFPPFQLTTDAKTGRLYGRGSSDDKGPIFGWINVLDAHHTLNKPLPVNIRFCFEGMEESGSEGLDEFILAEVKKGNDSWFDGVDAVCISDNYWLNTRTPALTYGLRGISYYKVTISGPAKDLHSGVYGRMVHEPMTDLIILMSKLVDPQGNILIPGVEELVPPPDEEERQLYRKIDYSIEDVEHSAGAKITISEDKAIALMGRMRSPSLSIHGIEGAFYGAGAKTVIPAKVTGKFSIRLVPPQTPDNVDPLVIKYVSAEFAKLGSKNTVNVENLHGGKPWVENYKHWNYEAAHRATEAVYKRAPDYMREGGSIPVTLTFAEALRVNVLLLPMGRGDDGPQGTQYFLLYHIVSERTKLLGSYLHEVGASTEAR
ncbi:CNDP dipeptidase [Russula aff. rugulosa BPL654]|nr:CNDP dipeptidase [Russula aff. rugulosa BPL654]